MIQLAAKLAKNYCSRHESLLVLDCITNCTYHSTGLATWNKNCSKMDSFNGTHDIKYKHTNITILYVCYISRSHDIHMHV